MDHISNTIYFPKDKKMQKLFEEIEKRFNISEKQVPRDKEEYFTDLVESIIGQQLSNKVADVITERVKKILGGKILPEKILDTDKEELRGVGVSYSKISYMKDLADKWLKGVIKYHEFNNLSDEEIIKEITTVKGIGRWTAEMFLMFTLKRVDVFSSGDLALKKAIDKRYMIKRKMSLKDYDKFAKKWSPNRTLASRVLWKSIDLK